MRTEAEIRKRIEMLEGFRDALRDRLEPVSTWLESPYLREVDRETAFHANLDYMLALKFQLKALEGSIFEMKFVVGDDEDWQEQQNRKNIDSLLKIPAGLIDVKKLSELLARAQRGERVRAYRSPTGDIWNVWDGNQRIELTERRASRLGVQFETSLHLYRMGGITLQEFESRVLSALQSAHVAPSPTSPLAENVEDRT